MECEEGTLKVDPRSPMWIVTNPEMVRSADPLLASNPSGHIAELSLDIHTRKQK